MATLDTNLYGFLSQAAGVGSVVSDGGSPETFRIFPVFAQEAPTLPCLIYRTVSAIRNMTLDGPRGVVRERVQIDVIADTYTACRSLADALRSALDGHSGTMGDVNVHYAHLQNQQDFYDGESAFSRISMDFVITYEEGV